MTLRAQPALASTARRDEVSATFPVVPGLSDYGLLGATAMGILTDSAIIAYKSPIVISKRLLKFAKGGPVIASRGR
jgi:hypothetical protein